MWSDEQDDEKPSWPRRLGRIAIGGAVIGGLCTAAYFVVESLSQQGKPPGPKQVVLQIHPVLPPPPPPPPPPPEKKVEEKQKIPEPKQAEKTPDKTPPKPNKPPAQNLTAAAGSGANPYGLAVGDGSGNVVGGGGGAGYQAYGRVVSTDVASALRRDDKLHYARFAAEVRLWLDAAGKVTRVQLTGTSGDPAIDSAVERSLSGLAMHEAPPQGLPQPIRLRARLAPG